MVEFRRWLPDDGAIMGSGGTRPTLYSLQSNARPLRDYVPVFTVSQVAKYVKFTVDSDRVLGNLYVTGEVTNFSHASSGHCYFTLKDGDSQLRCVKFRDDPGEEHLANGAAVTTHGRMTFYPARGELQYYVDLVQPEGVGEIHMDFLRVKAKLEAEGLFDLGRKRRLPQFPTRIGIVTSLAGAVVHDIQQILSRRYPLVELLLIHTPVQGEQAPAGIIAALKAAGAQR
ncbi:MAG: exodeoxyribonuclease large subunit, partial [Dehalococcoidia bacterium]|nr:exodeoxyribonuclease large subunit [Dehalococcoidia bacterium]